METEPRAGQRVYWMAGKDGHLATGKVVSVNQSLVTVATMQYDHPPFYGLVLLQRSALHASPMSAVEGAVAAVGAGRK